MHTAMIDSVGSNRSIRRLHVLVKRLLMQSHPDIWRVIQHASTRRPNTTSNNTLQVIQHGHTTLADLSHIAIQITEWLSEQQQQHDRITHLYIQPYDAVTLDVGLATLRQRHQTANPSS